MRTAYTAGAIAMAILTLSCGGGEDPPTTPNPVAASIVLTLTGASEMNAIGDTRSVSVTVRDADNATIAGAPVTFTTSNQAVATVAGNSSGATITAVGNGNATVTATSGAATQQLQVSVIQKLSAVTLATQPMVVGNTSQLQPVARDAKNAPIAGVTGFTITSATPGVVVVSPTGLATAIGPGTGNITASLTRDGVTKEVNATIAVTMPTQVATASITATTQTTFDPSSVVIERGGTVNFVFQGLQHNVRFDTPGSPDNVPESTNTTVPRVFPTAGTFAFHCSIHSNMTGSVNVVLGTFQGFLTGANERPNPSGSTGTGTAFFRRTGNTVSYIVTFQGLTGAPIGAHLHGPAGADGVADILVNFSVAGQTSANGVLTGTFNAANIQGVNGQPAMTLDELMALIQAGNTYVNVHTTQFTGGEIRGQMAPPPS